MRKRTILAATLLAVAALSAPITANAAPFAYVTNAFGPSVSVVDTATNQVAATVTFPAGSVPFAAAITPDLSKVYVTSLDGSTCGESTALHVIDTASNTLGSSPIAVPCEATGLALTPDGKRAYVTSRFTRTISVIDTAAKAIIATITPPDGSILEGIAISPNGQRAYVTAAHLDVVHVIDTDSNTVVSTVVGVGSSPKAVAVSPDGKRVYVTNNHMAGSVTVIDTATGTAVATIAVGQYPSALAFTPDGSRVYVTNGGIDNGVFTVSVIDTASYAVVGAPVVVGSFPNSIAITADGTQAYVGNEGSNTVSVIDTATDTVSATLGGMSSPRGVAARAIPPGIAVPKVVGQPQATATSAITAAGLTVGTVTRQSSRTVASGVVISQSPEAGKYVGSEYAVNLVVSSGSGGGGGGGGGGIDLLTLLALLVILPLARRSPYGS